KAYVLRRLGQSALTLVGVSVLVFVILRVIPGDPAKMLLPEGAPQSAVDELNRQLGLRACARGRRAPPRGRAPPPARRAGAALAPVLHLRAECRPRRLRPVVPV